MTLLDHWRDCRPIPGPCMCGDPECSSCGPLLGVPLDEEPEEDAEEECPLTPEEVAELKGDEEYHRRVDEGEPTDPGERAAAGLRR